MGESNKFKITEKEVVNANVFVKEFSTIKEKLELSTGSIEKIPEGKTPSKKCVCEHLHSFEKKVFM